MIENPRRKLLIKLLLSMAIAHSGITADDNTNVTKTLLNNITMPINGSMPMATLTEYETEMTNTSSSFRYALSDGQTRAETVEVVNKGQPDEHIKVNGSYSYESNGITYEVKYTAGKTGYRAKVETILPGMKRINTSLLKSLVG